MGRGGPGPGGVGTTVTSRIHHFEAASKPWRARSIPPTKKGMHKHAPAKHGRLRVGTVEDPFLAKFQFKCAHPKLSLGYQIVVKNRHETTRAIRYGVKNVHVARPTVTRRFSSEKEP